MAPLTRDGDQPFDLNALRDQIELLEIRLPGKAAQVKLAESTLSLAKTKHAHVKHGITMGRGSFLDIDSAEGEMLIAQAELDTKRSDHQEVELMIKQSKRKLVREEAIVKRALEAARAHLQQLSGREEFDPDPVRRARLIVKRLEEQLGEVGDVESQSELTLDEKRMALLRDEITQSKKKLQQVKSVIRNPNDPVLSGFENQIRVFEIRLKELEGKAKPQTVGAGRVPETLKP